MVFFGPFETQTASSVMTCQSGVPGTGKTAAGVMVDISRLTPGVLTPGRGGRVGRSFLSAAGDVAGSWPNTRSSGMQAPRATAAKQRNCILIGALFRIGALF